ncbi:MAG: DEAD/DEAH box helicase [Alphaproteobacteria bacterium]
MQFSDLGLSGPILKAVAAEGYETPTPIQQQAIPQVLEGRDLLGIAATGTGKTAAFALPILHRLNANNRRPSRKQCRALILSPTRELTAQIADSFRAYGRELPLRVAVIVGGVGFGPQVAALAKGVDILVATPGRLLDHIQQGNARLDATEILVLDEADHMLDMGFIPSVRKLVRDTPETRQTLLFSATMPKEIRSLADDFLRDPATVSVTPPATPAERIEQQVVFVEPTRKTALLANLITEGAYGRILVFTRTKHRADRVVKGLAQSNIPAAAIHGNKSQNQRERALGGFRTGDTPILVATDIAARGIDVDGVDLVVNYDLPNIPETYVHRIGRTARAGASGLAVSFCDGEERAFLRGIEKLIGRRIAVRPGTPEPAELAVEPRSERDRRPPRNQPRKQGRGNAPKGKTHGKPAGQQQQQPRPAQQHRDRKPDSQKPASGPREAARPHRQDPGGRNNALPEMPFMRVRPPRPDHEAPQQNSRRKKSRPQPAAEA